MSEVPTRLGKYHILELVAQGGMAEVYKAKSIGVAGFEKILAVKRIRPRYASEERFIKNFVDEARIAVTLNHRNIVQIFDFGRAEGELYLAMELLEGVDLRYALGAARNKGDVMPPALTCHILSEVASGLSYAHQKCDREGNSLGIVHCDVSPHNVMLSHDGFVKILDFGVARARFIAAPTSRRLRGKPRYMAPEQTLGQSPTAASDVFVVGILGWELLTKRRLFDGKDLPAILSAVRTLDIPHLTTLLPGLPRDLSDAIMRALSRNPQDRGTAEELGTQLARASRALSQETSAEALASWLATVFAEAEDTEETCTEVCQLPASFLHAQATQAAQAQATQAAVEKREKPNPFGRGSEIETRIYPSTSPSPAVHTPQPACEQTKPCDLSMFDVEEDTVVGASHDEPTRRP